MKSPAEREARRTAILLAASQSIVGSAAPICFAVGGLAGYYMLGADKALATAPVTGFTVGLALGAIPAAAIIRFLGQRHGFMTGTAITGLGGAASTWALLQGNFWFLVFAVAITGFGGAFVQQFRFAAADNAPPEFKARAISFVLAGGVVTAIIGPQIVIHTKEMLAPVMFAGSFLSIVGLALVGAAILSFLPLRPLGNATDNADTSVPRSLGDIARQPRFAVGLLCAVCSYALMTFLMTGAPLAMVGCGFTSDQATLGISWHVMAMFAPSFITGKLIHRFGAEQIVASGLVILLACAAIALSGIALWQFWTALILLGLGWNFGFIGATAMVADTYRPSEKGKVQGFHDFILFTSVAIASLMSGVVYNSFGWAMLSWIAIPLLALCAIGLATLMLSQRPARAQA
ncbi:MFS transporter [Mesorhizobium sp. NBSH29]|uniref:MFS transporter n=1 Tax=Mesorhizobium sp. NBSH29 TaxID=2654249 RepID=UPI0035BC6640